MLKLYLFLNFKLYSFLLLISFVEVEINSGLVNGFIIALKYLIYIYKILLFIIVIIIYNNFFLQNSYILNGDK